MRMISPGQNSKPAKMVPIVVFSVGGRRLAVRAEEVGGIWPWREAMPVPSGTPFVDAIMRQGGKVFPVYNLAERLQVKIRSQDRLWMIAKRFDGPMAVCIDDGSPRFEVLGTDSIHYANGGESGIVGTCRIGAEELPLYSLTRLGDDSRKG
jgi:chemotaxis signal transduction protein